MYKVIPNKKEFLNWKKHLPPEIEKVVQSSDIEELIARQIEALDYYYGTDRAIEADLGGYLLILYGTESDIEKELLRVLNYHHLKEEEYECMDTYWKPELLKKIQFRLYLCGSDYHVEIVIITESK